MFLKRNRKTINGEFYDYWTLCETFRTERGPRQRVVASLGKLTDDDIRAGWEDIEALLEGRKPSLKQADLASSQQDCTEPGWELADLRNLRIERVKEFGGVFLAMALWRRLGLDELLNQLMPKGRESVSWKDVAAVLTVAKFCGQASEFGVAQHWYETTALDEIIDIDSRLINDDRLYRGLDRIGEHKDELCSHLMQRYRDWFGVNFEFLLYDVTSTYFEGQSLGNPMAQRGYSRDKRSDRKQVCIGLVCTPEGLPLSYEVFAGNRTDVTTVEEVVLKMEERFGQAQRVWVMDRGMVSESNIAFLQQRKARYIVGTPKSQLRYFEEALLDKENWTEVQNGLEARLVKHPQADQTETYILCRSSDRAAKEKAMRERQMQRLSEELLKIDRGLRRAKKKPDLGKIERRIGRHLGKNPAAAKLLHIEVQKDPFGAPTSLQVYCPLEKGQSDDLRQGTYLLRTNCTETDPAQLWRWYVQLTQAESAFRTSKSDIGLRPIYHHKMERVNAHLLICFLSLAMWRTLEMWMDSKGLGTSARRLLESFNSIHSMDVVVPVKREERNIDLRLRTVAKPDAHVQTLLSHLELKLPRRSKLVQNVVEKNRA